MFHKLCILTEENYAFLHSADQKNRLHISDFAYSSLHFKQERRNWSPTFFNPSPPPSALFYTHAHKQINVATIKRIKIISKKKKNGCVHGGAPDQAWPPWPRGSGGGSAGPALELSMRLLRSALRWFYFPHGGSNVLNN